MTPVLMLPTAALVTTAPMPPDVGLPLAVLALGGAVVAGALALVVRAARDSWVLRRAA